jgi:hypothetical protein
VFCIYFESLLRGPNIRFFCNSRILSSIAWVLWPAIKMLFRAKCRVLEVISITYPYQIGINNSVVEGLALKLRVRKVLGSNPGPSCWLFRTSPFFLILSSLPGKLRDVTLNYNTSASFHTHTHTPIDFVPEEFGRRTQL